MRRRESCFRCRRVRCVSIRQWRMRYRSSCCCCCCCNRVCCDSIIRRQREGWALAAAGLATAGMLLLLLLLLGGTGLPLPLPPMQASRLGRARHPMGVLLYGIMLYGVLLLLLLPPGLRRARSVVLRYSSPRQQYPVRVLNSTVVPRGGWVPPVEVGPIRERRPASRRRSSCCHRGRIAVCSPVAPTLLPVLPQFPVPLPIVLSRAIVLPLPLVLPHELTT